MRNAAPALLLLSILRAGAGRATILDAPDSARVLDVVDALLPPFLADRLESLVRVAAEVCTFRYNETDRVADAGSH